MTGTLFSTSLYSLVAAFSGTIFKLSLCVIGIQLLGVSNLTANLEEYKINIFAKWKGILDIIWEFLQQGVNTMEIDRSCFVCLLNLIWWHRHAQLLNFVRLIFTKFIERHTWAVFWLWISQLFYVWTYVPYVGKHPSSNPVWENCISPIVCPIDGSPASSLRLRLVL